MRDFALGPLASLPLFPGCPVQTEQLVLAACQTRAEGFRLHFGIEPDKARNSCQRTGSCARFLGYSRWSAGKLGTRLAATWVVRFAVRLLPQAQETPCGAVLSGKVRRAMLAGEPEIQIELRSFAPLHVFWRRNG